MNIILLNAWSTMLAQHEFISYGALWRYYDLAQEPALQGGNPWYTSAYNSDAWSAGGAQLGYGDGDEVTEIGDSTLTAYFRHSFMVPNPSDFSSVDLDLLYDDGAVIYLNGVEVWRVNMPIGAINYGTFASTGSSDNAMVSTSLPVTLLQGENLLAVEVHQRSAQSSDLSFDFKLTAVPSNLLRITRGPYLQQGTSQSMVCKWRTSSATSSLVRYGTSLAQLDYTAQDTVNKIDHELKITGLQSATKYFYQIENDTGVLSAASSDQYFKTSPVNSTKPPITAWILGDCGTKNSTARTVRDAYYDYIDDAHTDMILFLGDNAYESGTDWEYQLALFENMYEEKLKNTVAWSCLGNHDGYTAQSSTQTGPYYDIFTFPTLGEAGGTASGTEAYYSFDYGNVHFISLDSYDSPRNVGGAMYAWCEQDLQNTSADWVVAFWHHPPYSKGSHDSDTEGRLVEMREHFLPLLEDYGVDLVLAGHSHSYERTFYLHGHYGNSMSFDTVLHTVGDNGDGDGQISGDGPYSRSGASSDGTVYITAGSSGKTSGGPLNHEAVFFDVDALGSCVLEVHGGELNVKFLRETGVIEDFFTIQKDLGCTVGSSCDDGDICTNNDTINALCQCLGEPISSVPEHLVLSSADDPLGKTFKANQSITTSGNLSVLSQSLSTLIAPEVLINPTFEVPLNARFEIRNVGCDP